MTTSEKPLIQPSVPTFDGSHAPFLYFEEAPNLGVANGVIHVTLATYRHSPQADRTITTDLCVVASLRCNIQAARSLRKALDDALLLATPPADGGKTN